MVHRRLETSTRLANHLDWPGLAQVCRLTRTTRRKPKGQSTFQKTVEIEYAITSVPPASANAALLLKWWREHWHIENRSHYVRDVTLGEDACTIHKGHAPQNLAALRNVVISLLRLEGQRNIASALRACSRQTQRLLTKLGILKQ